jgi:hypothetical protein
MVLFPYFNLKHQIYLFQNSALGLNIALCVNVIARPVTVEDILHKDFLERGPVYISGRYFTPSVTLNVLTNVLLTTLIGKYIAIISFSNIQPTWDKFSWKIMVH